MPVLSYVHQLFNADTCDVYIHRLRWKDRPRQCPRCHSQDVDPWGQYHYRPGLKRYWCNGCRRTFNDLTETLFAHSKRSLPHWILATFLLCLSCSSRRIARELGVHIRTSYRWCWWLRNAALSYEMLRQLEGTVEADDLYHTAGNKGQAKQGGKKSLGRRARGRRKKREPGRGHYDKDRPAIIAWVSRQGLVVVQATRDFTVSTVQKAADLTIEVGSRLYTDSASSYRALKGYIHEFVNHTKKEYARGEIHENRAECLFSLLKPYLRVFRGISKFNLPGYLGFFQFLRNFRQQHAFGQAEMILHAALDPAIASRARKGAFVTCFDHFDLLQTAINWASAVRSAYTGHPPETEESFLAIVAAQRVVVQWCFALHAVRAVCELTCLSRGDSIIADHREKKFQDSALPLGGKIPQSIGDCKSFFSIFF